MRRLILAAALLAPLPAFGATITAKPVFNTGRHAGDCAYLALSVKAGVRLNRAEQWELIKDFAAFMANAADCGHGDIAR